MEQKFNRLVSHTEVVSKPGAALRVEVLHLTEAGRNALTTTSSKPLPGANLPQRGWLQRMYALVK